LSHLDASALDRFRKANIITLVLRLKFEALRTLIPGVLAVVSKPARYIQ